MFLRAGGIDCIQRGSSPTQLSMSVIELETINKGGLLLCLSGKGVIDRKGDNLIEANSIGPIIAMPRPQTAGARAESELKQLANKKLVQSVDPVEKLRCYCLTRGANGILGLGR